MGTPVEGGAGGEQMSRYPIPAHDRRYQVVVGWDGPLETYFAQVFDTTQDDDDTACVLWEGHALRAIATVEALHTCLRPFATIPSAIIAQLRHDCTHAVPRSPLQERMLQLFTPMPRR
jgi:hypothetical protein